MPHPSTDTPAPSRVRLGGPDEIVAAIPHLLGFHPRESVVLLGLRGRRDRVCLSLRVDLPDPAHESALAAMVTAHLRNARARAAIVLVVTDVPAAGGGLPRRSLADALRSALAAARIGLRDVLCVHRQRWWSYGCERAECCPREGRPVRPEAASVLAAASVAEGRVVHADRDALIRVLAPIGQDDEADRCRLFADTAGRQRAALSSTAGRRAMVARIEAVVRAWADRPGDLGADDAVAFCVALARLEVRDDCLRWLDGPLADAAEGLWLALVRAAAPGYTPAPATLLALHAYGRGDGTFARICAERALSDTPGYPMAALVHEALDRGLPPAAIRELAAWME